MIRAHDLTKSYGVSTAVNAISFEADAPKTLQMIASVDPLSYGVDGLRAALIGVAHFGVATDLVVLSAFTTVFLSIGGYLFSKIQI